MSAIPNISMRPELAALIEKAQQHKMTPAEYAAQRRSYVLGEMAIGSDADEAEYRAAHDRRDMKRCLELIVEGEERMKRAEVIYDGRYGI